MRGALTIMTGFAIGMLATIATLQATGRIDMSLPEKIEVPCVSEKSLDEALLSLGKEGFNVSVEFAYGDYPPGTIVSMNPCSGNMARPGKCIKVFISLGTKEELSTNRAEK